MKVEDLPDDVLIADGLDEALIGYGRRFTDHVAIYSIAKCLQCYAKMGMTYEEAREYFEFNVVGAYVGDSTPIFMEDEHD